jgi:xylulokinase
MNYFVGVDIGTTGIRAGIYNEDFELLGNAHGRSVIKRGPRGEITQDPEEFYTETAGAVRSAIEGAGIDKNLIACLSFDGQMAGIMGIDVSWHALTPYDSWLDTRCSKQVAKIRQKAYKQVIEKTGNVPGYNHGPKILWWKENEGDIFQRIESFIQPNAYVAGRLCGLTAEDAFTDWTYLHFSCLADNRSLQWDSGLTALFGIPQEKLPKIVSPFSIIGTTNREEAQLFGVAEGIPVAAGCGDTASCFLGTGAVDRGIAVDVAGTASVFALAKDDFLVDLSGTVYASRSVAEDLWYSMSYINGGGLNLEWFKSAFAQGKSFDDLDESTKDIEPGSHGLIFNPHLEGRGYPYNPDMRGQWKGFTRDHALGHFYRSILEGIGYEYSLYKEKILGTTQSGRAYEVRVVGGGSKSPVWNQIKADILGCSYCTINREDISILGQALIAAAASGHIKDMKETVRNIVTVEKIFHPVEKHHRMYEKRIADYKNMLEGWK